MNGTIAYALSKQYVADTADSLGSLKGAPCTIKSITEVDGGQKVTFEWTGTSGTKQTSEMTVKNGVSVTGISDKGNGKFTLLFSDGSESDPIQTVKGQKGDKGDKLTFNDLTDEEKASLKGENGVSPTITENADNTDKIYKLDVTTADGTFTTPNLKGKDGSGSSTGEENVIESIKVNGVVQTVSDDKSVDITVPTVDVDKNYVDTELAKKANTSDIPSLEEYVTETELNAKGYLTEHQDISGKVDKVEGKSLISDTEIARLATVDNYDDTAIKVEIAKKADTTAIPSKVSELTNDSNYQTAEQVNSTVTTEIAKVVADAPEDLNTLKEMSDWIAGHEDDASAMNSAISDNKTAIASLQTGKADKSEIPTTVAELTDSADYAKTSDIPTTLPANGGNSDTVNNHTVETDVPTDAVFTDTTYSDATQMEHGLMSVDDKKKLDGLTKYTPDGTTITADEDGTLHGVKVTVDDALSDTSTNPVQNKVVKAYVDENVDFSTSTSKLLNDSIESPMLVTNATVNLIPGMFDDRTFEGITYTSNGDGTYSVKGSLNGNISSYTYSILVNVQKGKTYKVLGSKSTNISQVSVYKKDNATAITSSKDSGIFIADEDQINLCLYVPANSEGIIDEILKPMLTTDLDATYDDFVPYSGYDIKTCGKNLLDLKNKGKDTYTNAGITYTKQSDGSYKRKGTATSTPANIWLFGGYKIEPNGTNHLLTLKKGHTYFINDCVLFSMVNGMEWVANNPSVTPGVHTITPLQDTYITGIRDYGISKDNTYNDIVYPRVFEADHDLGWSPYTESTIHIDSSTEFPLIGLKSFDGITNIISPANVKCVYPTNESGKGVLDSLYNKDKMLSEQNESLSVIGKCKNLLNPTLKTTTQDGITCTNNGDGTYTLNGTCSVNSQKTTIVLTSESMKIDEDVKFICCTQSGSSDTFRASVDYDDGTYSVDYGEGTLLSKGKTITKVSMIVNNGVTVKNLVFKPMLTTNLNATFEDFVPYTGDGDTLTHDVATLTHNVDKQNDSLSVIGKCKNLLNPTLQTTTKNGVTCTNNGDGTYTVSGTATKNFTFSFINRADTLDMCQQFKGKFFKFISNINDIEQLGHSYMCIGQSLSEDWNKWGSQINNGKIAKIDTQIYGIVCDLHIFSGDTFDNVLIKPMLTTDLSATYDDFVPYTGDGDTLTHDVAELKNDLDKIKPSVVGSDWNKSWTYTVSSTTPKMFALHWSNSTVIFCVFYGKVIPFNQPFAEETYTANVDGNTLTVTTSETGILRTI